MNLAGRRSVPDDGTHGWNDSSQGDDAGARREQKVMGGHHHVFPWWAGYLLASPLRKLLQDPDKILAPYLKPGMQVLEIGPGMGFFSVPLARMVGASGKVVCVDIQEKMLAALKKRAEKAGVGKQVEARLCTRDSFGIIDLASKVDFALLLAIVHEVPDSALLWKDVVAALKSGGTVLFSEPSGPVSEEEFKNSIAQAEQAGLKVIEYPEVRRSRSAVLKKQ